MTRKIYTFGYIGQDQELLKRTVEGLGAYLFDIRYSPRSRSLKWNKSSLQALLGQRYKWVKAFGNENYNTDGPIKIVDFEAGRLEIDRLSSPVILMCACKHAEWCHRSVVGEQLVYMGYMVQELNIQPPTGQISLF